ncbi:MAG: helix-turn-helix transcriptional regulator [Lachnospiraceae bacterium]|nr:helix-turn-helix transcriptional regulator [Lachnospiraceae bacterium]
MAQKSVKGNEKLAKAIKTRRNELELTIEEAATRAGVGTKTWCRYEAGESIRRDKYKGVCKALNWMSLPGEDVKENFLTKLEKYRNHEAWSKYIADCFGEVAAVSFAIGSDILMDYIKEDMTELLKMPKGTHIGQIGVSYLVDILPQQFCMEYNYEFLYALHTLIVRFRKMAHCGTEFVAHSVLQELMMYLIVEESRFLIENSEFPIESGWDNWIFELFDDADIITFLYSDYYLTEDNSYHFKYWMKEQFYCR